MMKVHLISRLCTAFICMLFFLFVDVPAQSLSSDKGLFDTVFERFNSLKNDIYNVYNNRELLDAKYIRITLQYLDDFYATINNQKDWQRVVSYPCDKNGTGNIVIKGLKEN